MSQDPPSLNPLVLRERLAEYLRHAREQLEWSQGYTADQVGWSVSKLQRIETAVVSVSMTDTKALVDLYGLADDETTRRLLTMARQSRRRDQFTQYKKFLTAEYQALLSYERSASEVRSANSFVLPGLLQTPDYARALLSVKHTGAKLQGLVEARELRQQILIPDNGPFFVFLIDEAMLYRQVGGRDVLLAQLDRLRGLSKQENLEIRIIPFDAGAHLGLWEPFMLMTIPGFLATEGGETIVYRETGDTEYLIRGDDERIGNYEKSFTQISAQALSRSRTRDVIDRAKHRLDTPEAAPSNSAR
jgi:transcriptional regulator with XRE-family HTH domain